MKETNICYTTEDKLELIIRLYFDKTKLSFIDIDNRLKGYYGYQIGEIEESWFRYDRDIRSQSEQLNQGDGESLELG